jgi:polar amino acid transport system ATP-binding protein
MMNRGNYRMGTTMVRMENVRKNFGDLEVLKDISFELKQGEVVAVIGPSGSGKSTLLRCLNRLETIDGGSIAIEGEYLVRDAKYVEEAEARRICGKMGMVFQQFNLFPHMTVLDNLLEAPMIVKKMARAEILPIAEELLRKIGLEEKRDVYPTKLSGGQQQRVAIARALL